MQTVRFRTLGCYPLTGAVESDGRHAARRSSRRCCSPRTSERQGRVIDHDAVGVDGEEEAGRLLLMAPRPKLRPASPTRHRRATSRQHEHKSLLRFITCGSVDDGKIDADRPPAVRLQDALRGPARGARGRLARRSARRAASIDFALLVDGLAAEREQGITIDVAYRFFSTDKRKFIVADTPGPRAVHAQHGHRRLDRRRSP